MNDKDKEAFEKCRDMSEFYASCVADQKTALVPEDVCEGFVAGWQAACEYKQKEIDELLDNEDMLRIHMNGIGYRELKKLQAENKQLKTENDILSGEGLAYKKMSDDAFKKLAKLRECVEFYALKNNWGYNEKPKNQRHLAWMIENHDCGYCPENEKFVGGKRARQVLKELENK